MIKKASLVMLLGLVTACMPSADFNKGWNVQQSVDPFTDQQLCRVMHGTKLPAPYRTIMITHFVFERRGTEQRVGIISGSNIPISGDLQIRVDDNPMHVITVADTPLDSVPETVPYSGPTASDEHTDAMREMQQNIMKHASPARLATGDKAQAIIADILSGSHVMFRQVGINVATSTTGAFDVNDELRAALKKCGVG